MQSFPNCPGAQRERYINELGLSEYDAAVLTRDPDVASYFETLATNTGDAKLAANWVNGELAAALNRAERSIAEAPICAAYS